MIRVMACPLFCIKLLPEPMLTCCQLDPSGNKLQWNLNQNTSISFVSRKCISKCNLQNACHFLGGASICFISMGWYKKDVTPLLTHWSYVFLALTHWYNSIWSNIRTTPLVSSCSNCLSASKLPPSGIHVVTCVPMIINDITVLAHSHLWHQGQDLSQQTSTSTEDNWENAEN